MIDLLIQDLGCVKWFKVAQLESVFVDRLRVKSEKQYEGK